MSQSDNDRREIRQLVENWALWRDAGTGTASPPSGTRATAG